ncbi:MAG: hypothetical protein ACOX7F_05870 [Eubacteriales bacterium]|jgi:hypothetical protein
MKDLLEKINVVETLAVTFTGAALIAGVVTGQQEVVLALGGGLVGFLGAMVPPKS